MELKEYLAPLQKWWWLLLAATLIAAISSFLVTRQQSPVYQSRTTLMIGRAIDDPNPNNQSFFLGQQLAQSYADIARREPVKRATMEALGLNWLPYYTARALPQTQLIEIVVSDTSPERAQAVAQELANQLILRSPTARQQEEQERQQFINQQLDELQAKIQETNEEVAAKEEELGELVSARQIAEVQSQILALHNRRTTLQTIYSNLLSNTQQGAVNTISVIEPAAYPWAPVGSNKSMAILLAAGVGFVLAASAAYLLEYLDDTVKSPNDVRRVANLPTLAGITRLVKEEDDDKNKLITVAQPRSPVSEAYRVLRTSIQFSSVDSSNSSLLVTSANPNEGKSTVAANVAIVMAQAGNNVLIVDADLRRPTQHGMFELSNARGLTSLLLELDPAETEEQTRILLNKTIQPTPTKGLHVLTSGPIPPNPSELLGSDKMRTLLSRLLAQFDFVLFDSPPALAVTDAVVLSTRIDSVLLVVDAGGTRRAHLKQVTAVLQEVNAKVMGVALNRLSSGDGYLHYSYYRHAYYVEDSESTTGEKPALNGKIRHALLRSLYLASGRIFRPALNGKIRHALLRQIRKEPPL